MGSLTKNFARIGAVLAISSLALVGCSSTADAPSDKTTQSQKATADSAEAAAIFANEFFATLIEPSTTDYSKLTPPIELTDEQAEQLMLDGKVDGVSDEKLDELVDFLYEQHELGSFLYFDKNATIQERLQGISALIMAQSFAGEMEAEQAPEKILPEAVTVSKVDGRTVASFAAGDGSLAPSLIFADGQWWIDGKALLESFTGGVETAPEATTPTE